MLKWCNSVRIFEVTRIIIFVTKGRLSLWNCALNGVTQLQHVSWNLTKGCANHLGASSPKHHVFSCSNGTIRYERAFISLESRNSWERERERERERARPSEKMEKKRSGWERKHLQIDIWIKGVCLQNRSVSERPWPVFYMCVCVCVCVQ